MIGGGSISLTAPLCVIPEGAGPVKGAGSVAVVVLCFLRRVLGERQRGVGVQDRPEADRVAAAGPGGPRRAGGCCSARRTVCGRRSFLLIGFGRCSSAPGFVFCWWTGPWVGCLSFLRRDGGGMEWCDR